MTDLNCVNCQSEKKIQEHHISYEPEMTISLCVECHKKVHGSGVGKSNYSQDRGYSTKEKKIAAILNKSFLTQKEVAKFFGCSRGTLNRWSEKYLKNGNPNDEQHDFAENLKLEMEDYKLLGIADFEEIKEDNIPV